MMTATTDLIAALAIAAANAAVFCPLGWWAGKRYRWRGFWRKPEPTMPPAFELPPITMSCPHCGEEYTIQISGGPEAPDPSTMPLGERLQAEKRQLQDRMDAAAFDDHATRERYRRRIAAIDEQLRRFH
jgi:hypothetical protein